MLENTEAIYTDPIGEPYVLTAGYRKLSELSKQETDALKATSEALVTIRALASKPVTEETRQVIFALADAFHNIPMHASMPETQREACAFMLTAGVEQARQANKRHGLKSQHLAPL